MKVCGVGQLAVSTEQGPQSQLSRHCGQTWEGEESVITWLGMGGRTKEGGSALLSGGKWYPPTDGCCS